MNVGQRRRYERDERVVTFMNAVSEDFRADSKGAALSAQLKELMAQVAALELERAANAGKRRQGTEGREEARTTLRRMLRSVWDTYKAVTLDHPEINGLLEPPSKSTTDHALVTAARAYAAAVTPHAAIFAEYDVTAAFLDDLRSKADAIESHVALQNTGAGQRVGATAAVEEKLRQADEVVERLDAVIRNKYHDDAAKLASWESARRVERAPRHKPDEEEVRPPQPPPAND